MQSIHDSSNLAALTELSSTVDEPVVNKQDLLVNASYLQRKLFEIWSSLLGFSSFGLQDDLFDVGGDSITAIQIFSAIHEEFGISLPIEELFSADHFSISWLSELVESHLIQMVGVDDYKKLMNDVENLAEESVNISQF